jgi:RimJ/RimL family protein N-acetyltransferase
VGVWERNERAKAFYLKCGFVDVGSHIFGVGSDPQTDRVMVCDAMRTSYTCCSLL